MNKFIDALCSKNFDPGTALKDLNGGEFQQVELPELNGREIHEAYINSTTLGEFKQYFNSEEEAVNIWYEFQFKYQSH